jgi:hypothetical protein
MAPSRMTMVVQQDLQGDQLKRMILYQQDSEIFSEHRRFQT